MKKAATLLLLIFIQLSVFSQYRNVTVDMSQLHGHPRLLLLDNEKNELKQFVNAEPCWKKIHNEIINTSNNLLNTPVAERKMVGRRLLDVSRASIRNIFFLSYAYRMTNNREYAKRAETELLAISSFSDWNPSHFLDVGEMTLGVAIGYDWLYDYLSPESRRIIRNAIVAKGIKPSMDKQYNSFLTAQNNWSQVCNAGISYGALSIAEDYPELSKQIIERSLNNIYMGDYAPDGAYPEGAGYWSYGTSFSAMFISAIEKIFKTDFGLSQTEGFKQTPVYAQDMVAPDKFIFNYSDSDESGKAGLNATLFWFANKFNDSSLLWTQKEELTKDHISQSNNRILPALLIWAKGIKTKSIFSPSQLMFCGQGPSPVALMRTSWTDNTALFLGYKLGSPAVSHAHMDVGSFVFVANGVRWAADFGMQQYESLESKGLNIFNTSQKSQRWQIFRYKNSAHNTLTFDGKLQVSSGYAKIDKSLNSDTLMYAISDLSNVYKNQIKKATRGVAIVNKQYAVIRDEIEPVSDSKMVRWNMMTKTKIVSIKGNTAILSQNGTKLMLRVDYPLNVKIKTWDTTSPNDWDAPNKGATFIGFEVNLSDAATHILQVSLIPDIKNEKKFTFNKYLNNW